MLLILTIHLRLLLVSLGVWAFVPMKAYEYVLMTVYVQKYLCVCQG